MQNIRLQEREHKQLGFKCTFYIDIFLTVGILYAKEHFRKKKESHNLNIFLSSTFQYS